MLAAFSQRSGWRTSTPNDIDVRRLSDWRVLAAERPVVADIGPDTASFGLAFRQDRNRGVIAVQALSRQNVAFDQPVQGPQCGGAGADQVSEPR